MFKECKSRMSLPNHCYIWNGIVRIVFACILCTTIFFVCMHAQNTKMTPQFCALCNIISISDLPNEPNANHNLSCIIIWWDCEKFRHFCTKMQHNNVMWHIHHWSGEQPELDLHFPLIINVHHLNVTFNHDNLFQFC